MEYVNGANSNQTNITLNINKTYNSACCLPIESQTTKFNIAPKQLPKKNKLVAVVTELIEANNNSTISKDTSKLHNIAQTTANSFLEYSILSNASLKLFNISIVQFSGGFISIRTISQNKL